jgi:hypothetical protein
MTRVLASFTNDDYEEEKRSFDGAIRGQQQPSARARNELDA